MYPLEIPTLQAEAFDYYVDATAGNDSNSGTQSLPWKTIAKVNGFSFGALKRIGFKRGEVWRETLTVPSSGVEGNRLVFGAYGGGAKPQINGANIVTVWTVQAGTTWKATVTTAPTLVIMDGVWLTLGSGSGSLNDHEWFWAANLLYVRDDSGDPDTTGVVIQAAIRNTCISLTDKDYITITDLDCSYSNFAGIWNERGDYVTISNCDLLDSDVNGFLCRGTTANDSGRVLGLIVEDCYCGTPSLHNNTLIQVRGSTGAIIRNNTIAYTGAAGSAIGTQTGNINGNGALNDGTKIYGNDIYGSNAGILVQYVTDGEVYFNHIHDGGGYGIAFNRNCFTCKVYYNLIHDLTERVGAYNGIDINIGCTNGFAYGNTIYKVAGFCFTLEALTSPSTGWTIKNNIFDSSQNIDVGGVNASLYIEAGISYTFDTNLYFISDAIKRGNGETIVDLATWNAKSGVGTDLEGDPLFVNAAGDDYQLQANSPANGTGTNLGVIYQNALNRAQETLWDIGAYVKV